MSAHGERYSVYGHPIKTDLLSFSDNAMKSHHIGMSELAHNGPLLQELDPVHLLCRWVEGLDGHILCRAPRGWWSPLTFVDCAKLARSKTFCDSGDSEIEAQEDVYRMHGGVNLLYFTAGDNVDLDLLKLSVQTTLTSGWELIDLHIPTENSRTLHTVTIQGCYIHVYMCHCFTSPCQYLPQLL